MSSQPPRPPTRRAPLGEATRRVNNAQQSHYSCSSKQPPFPHHGSLRQNGLLQESPGSSLAQGDCYPLREFDRVDSPGSGIANPRLSAISKEYPGANSNRDSQISTTSTNASDGKRIKAMIGPWKLGKTLGKGATARVRLARHAYTGQEAAIKIVQKKNAQLSQAGSLAALDRAEANMPDPGDSLRRMPVGIEREVAIMKLIQHPNIMKLYDIWENRTEIYLVLEYADNGELFEQISRSGGLPEEEAVKYFRQILSAVGYCHSFKICHRDLKPENILLTKNLDIKIADFGMAALHQSPDHKLKTSCGSPHYAAPELIKGSTYHGDRVDIWSMGVILYATLAGRLPFDVEGNDKDFLPPLLSKIRKGLYEMAPEFSIEASNLIWRILQVNPRDRISLNQIWRHPLIRKYDYLDNLGGGENPIPQSVKTCVRPVLRKSDISKELLRHLRSMWHRLSEQELMDALLSEEPNDQKSFYSLLLKYRDEQLENYSPDIGYSIDDYHHVRPVALNKTYSTRHFPQPKGKSHGRQVSRFTVISNVAETEQSYDPFKASRPQYLDSSTATNRPKITIHRTRPSANGNAAVHIEPTVKSRQLSRNSVSVAGSSNRIRHPKLSHPRGFSSRSSLASSTRSRQSSAMIRAPMAYKRGISFNHLRRPSGGSHKVSNERILVLTERHSNHTEVTDDGGSTLRAAAEMLASTRYIRSRKSQLAASKPLVSVHRPGRASLLWTDDVRQLSSSLAKDCDEAFNRSSVTSKADSYIRDTTPLSSLQPSELTVKGPSASSSVVQGPALRKKARLSSLDTRPLPPPPARSESVNIELLEARKQAQLRKTLGGDESPGYLDHMVSHIDRLIQPGSPSSAHVDKRASSAPVGTKCAISNEPLPSIFETCREEESSLRDTDFDKFMDKQRRADAKNNRTASAPEARVLHMNGLNDRFPRHDSNLRNTIRVVEPSSPGSPVKVPAPLTIRKKSSQSGQESPLPGHKNDIHSSRHHRAGLELRQQNNTESKLDVSTDLERIDETCNNHDFANDSNSGTIIKKKSTWFRRNSKSADEQSWRMSIGGVNTIPSQPSSNETVRPRVNLPLPILPKKKFSLGRLFRKRSSQQEMSTAMEIFDDNESVSDSIDDVQMISQGNIASNPDDPKLRQIEPQRNWLAKLFNVQPVSNYICCAVSKRRARQEILTILKEWKRFGIRDVQVDKKRNIVFGRVAARNFLEIKEVAFAGEIMTVIEHGKRSHLSIIRFTQERGAASSFHQVVETMEAVLKCRGMLVGDERKKRMMVKTLRSS